MVSRKSVICLVVGICVLAAAAASAQTVTIVSGNYQLVPENSLSSPMVVVVRDASGKPVAGTTVTWALASGSTGVNISPTTTTTDVNGQTSNRVLGTVILNLTSVLATSTVNATALGAEASFTVTTVKVVSGAPQA